MAFTKNLTRLDGSRFERLTVVREVERAGKHIRQWECTCDCGSVVVVRHNNLTSGNSKSCGCLVVDTSRSACRTLSLTHGCTYKPGTRLRTGTYISWQSMKSRCYTPRTQGFDHYGGRGIRVCDRWIDDFPAFLSDMGERPHGTTLDRIDVNGNYEPGNCRWATSREQSLNKRRRRSKFNVQQSQQIKRAA